MAFQSRWRNRSSKTAAPDAPRCAPCAAASPRRTTSTLGSELATVAEPFSAEAYRFGFCLSREWEDRYCPCQLNLFIVSERQLCHQLSRRVARLQMQSFWPLLCCVRHEEAMPLVSLFHLHRRRNGPQTGAPGGAEEARAQDTDRCYC